MAGLGCSRDKIRPARQNTRILGRFAHAGRVLSRFGCEQAERGEFCPAARLEAAAQLVEDSGEMLGLVTAPVGGQLPGVNTYADR